MKTSEDTIVNEVSKDLTIFLRHGDYCNFDPIIKDLNLNIDRMRDLIKIHFILTGNEGEKNGNKPGVINFVRHLKKRLRRIKTNVKKERSCYRGKIEGRINWKHTFQKRYQTNYKDHSLFVCEERERNYDIQENLVLKRLLQIIYNIVENNLKPFYKNNKNYEWLSEWTIEKEKSNLRNVLKNTFLRNVYLRRIDLEDIKITSRMINRAKRSRNELYREAGYLLGFYRKLMKYKLNTEEVEDLLQNTFIKPAKTDVLFELYWILKIFKIRDKKENENAKLLLIEPSQNENLVAKWSLHNKIYKLYHDSTGNLQFLERIKEIKKSTPENEFLKRQIKVLEALKKMVGGQREKSLWGGRPDIILEIYEDSNDSEKLNSIFIGEVKYTDDRGYAVKGLRELLEYVALIKETNEIQLKDPSKGKDEKNEYINQEVEKLFSGMDFIKGGLFLDDIKNLNFNTVKETNKKIRVYQFSKDEKILKNISAWLRK